MVDFNTVLQFIQATGIIVGVAYYIMNIQNNQKNQEIAIRNQELTLQSQELSRKAQEQQLETRQAQLFMQIFQEFSSVENFKVMNDVLAMEWEDYDDFMNKYSGEVNQDAFAKRYSIQYRFDGIGLLVREGLIDLDRVHDLMWTFVANIWDKYGEVNVKHREVYNNPSFMEGFEYLANELKKMRIDKGFSPYGPMTNRPQ